MIVPQFILSPASVSQLFVLEQVSEDVTEAYVYADLYVFLAVIYVFCVPYFYHAFVTR